MIKKIILSFLFFSLMFKISSAQSDSLTKKFIREVIPFKGIIYTNSLDSNTIEQIKIALKETIYNDKFFNQEKRPQEKLAFTATEKAYIGKQIDSLKFNIWKYGLIENSIVISTDTIKKIFYSKAGDGWNYYYKHYGKAFYRFSKPIFIRNNTLCIFYSDYSCGGLCGRGGLYIYINKNGIWQIEAVLYNWIS